MKTKTIKLKYADQAKEFFPNILGIIAAAQIAEHGEYKCVINGIKTKIVIDMDSVNNEYLN